MSRFSPWFYDFDDFYDNWSSRWSDPNFGISFHPRELRTARTLPRLLRTPSGYTRNWSLSTTSDRKDEAAKQPVLNEKDGFQVCLDVQHFSPNEITVKTVDNYIVVEGKHEEREDDHGLVSRQFVRRYALPKGFNMNDVVSTLSSDGVLTIKAPPVNKSVENKEKVIQIQITGPAHLTVKDETKTEDKPEKAEC